VRRLGREVVFLNSLMQMNLASAMEYRASFISQALGMLINNGIYFLFWLIYFDRFEEIRGYRISEIYLLFAVVAGGFGLAFALCGNARNIPAIVAQGRLDYYLALPRPVLPHVLMSRLEISTIGDISFAVLAFLFAGQFSLLDILLFLIVSILTAIVFVSFSTLLGSLAFYLGNAQQLSGQAINALITFALYPTGLFKGWLKFVLLTIVPATFVGAVPVELITTHRWETLVQLALFALALATAATLVFYTGLRRYESGSALNVNL
jgi:ABC-2 type transport system permease protein